MSTLKTPLPAKLVCSLIFQQEGSIHRVADALGHLYGTIDLESPVMPFDWTSYYEAEFGKDLKRIFLGLSELIAQDALVDVKHNTCRLEQELSSKGKRSVNIDPGILTAERLVLASGKNFPHRIYLGRGVYGDLTLVYQKGSFCPLPWTYPDYASQEIIEFWNRVRRSYLKKIKFSATILDINKVSGCRIKPGMTDSVSSQ